MGPIGIPELIIVLVILLVIFGPKRLPGLGRSLGSGMREFKDSITGDSKDDDDDDDRRALEPAPAAPTTTPADAAPAATTTEARDEPPVSEPRAVAARPPDRMATALRRPVSHEDRLSLTEHLDELRSRLIICVLGSWWRFGFCFWQNDAILEIVNKPLEQTQNLDGKEQVERPARAERALPDAQRAQVPRRRRSACGARRRLRGARRDRRRARPSARRTQRAAAAARRAARGVAAAAAAEPTNKERQPVTLGVAEPFTTTVSVAFYAALLHRAAAPALPGVRVHPAGVRAGGAQGRAAADGDGARSCSSAAWRSATSSCCRERSGSCRTSTTTTSTSSSRRRTTTGSRSLFIGGDRAAVPDPDRRDRDHAAEHPHAAPAAAELGLRPARRSRSSPRSSPRRPIR